MPLLDSLPVEILNSVVHELVASSYQEDRQSFGPTLQALSRVNRCLAKLCEPYRYRNWNLTKDTLRPLHRLRQHLVRPRWAGHVQRLVIPIYDCRYSSYQKWHDEEDVKAYDELLAAVVDSALHLKEVTFVFGVGCWRAVANEDRDLLLARTLQACLRRKEVAQLRFSNLDDLRTCKIAVHILQQWTSLRSLEIEAAMLDSHPEEEDMVLQNLMGAVAKREDLVELTYHIPPCYRGAPFPSLDSVGSTSRLTKMRIKSLSGDLTDDEDSDYEDDPETAFTHGWGPFNLRAMQISPHITDLEVPLEYLYLSVQETGERLDWQRLQILRLDTAIFSQCGFHMTLDELLAYLSTRIGVLSKQSTLPRLHLIGCRAIDVLELLLAKHPIPSLKVVSVHFASGPDSGLQTRLEALRTGCEASAICLHLNVEPVKRRRGGGK